MKFFKKQILNKILAFLRIFKIGNWLFLYHYALGLKSMVEHKYNNAIKQFEKSLSFGNNIYNLGLTYIRLGCCYFDIGIKDKAKYYLLKGLEINPTDKNEAFFGTGPEISSRLGVIYAEEGDYIKAKEYLENAKRLKPKRLSYRSYTNWEMVDKYLKNLNNNFQDNQESGNENFKSY